MNAARVPVGSTFALVDADDLELVSVCKWRLHEWGYAIGFSRGIRMHRLILGLERGDPRLGDHINRDKLDNRRSNLRIVTPAQNSQNVPGFGGSSQFRGVTWNKRLGKWQASVRLAGHTHYLGLFEVETDAADVARAFRIEHMPFSNEDAPAAFARSGA